MRLAVVGLLALSLAGAFAAETRKAVVGAGCFWCTEAMFEQRPGVVAVTSGYAGGKEPNPTYPDVSAGRTTHAEVIEIEYDPAKTSFAELIEFFWKTHDPTDPRGVWPDLGPQYRSIILYQNDDERRTAEASKAALEKSLGKRVATEVVPLGKFHPAEAYHQDYVRKNPNDRYVVNIAIPKLKKLGLAEPPRLGTVTVP